MSVCNKYVVNNFTKNNMGFALKIFVTFENITDTKDISKSLKMGGRG